MREPRAQPGDWVQPGESEVPAGRLVVPTNLFRPPTTPVKMSTHDFFRNQTADYGSNFATYNQKDDNEHSASFQKSICRHQNTHH